MASKTRKTGKTSKTRSVRKPAAVKAAEQAPKLSATDKVYAAVTARIIAQLESGVVPWFKPWVTAYSLTSRKAYRGINALVLATAPFKSPYWLTFKQAKALGGSVRKGEQGYPVVFWKWYTNQAETVEDETEDNYCHDDKSEAPAYRRAVPFYYTVFNVEQCDGIPADKIPGLPNREHKPIEQAEQVLAGYAKLGGPAVIIGGAEASYSPRHDVVRLPAPEAFANTDHYYGAAFHEQAHSTGHPKRLDRFSANTGPGTFGSAGYSREELVAEITSAMLCAVCGIERQQTNSTAYIAGWLAALRNDRKLLVGAAQAAQKAADYMQGIKQVEQSAESAKAVSHV